MQPFYTRVEDPCLKFLGSFEVKGKIYDSYSDQQYIFIKSGDRSKDHKCLDLPFITNKYKHVQIVRPEFYIAYLLHLMNQQLQGSN